MAINVTKPAINLREKLNEVTLETGIKGEELLNSDTSTEARNVLELDTHLFTDFESTGIDDNATSTAITIDASENVGIGTTSPAKGLHVYHATTNRPALIESGDADALLEFKDNATAYAPAVGATGNNLIFQTGAASAERMRIDSSGEVMIKHASAPSFVLSREDASSNIGDLIGAIGFRNLDTSSGTEPNYCGIKAKVSGGAGSDGELEFYTGRATYEADSGAAVFIRDTGEMELALGNLKFGTAGKGIDFSATSDGSGTMTSEVLDDYEEGTFTPTVVGLTTAGVATYTLRSARYTKIGNIVTFELGVGWSAHTGTGILAINGLPFTTGGSRKIFTVGRMIGLTTSELGMRSWSEASSTQVRFITTDTAGVESQINLDASVTMLYVSGTYQT
jgi:hypothetical protein